MSYQKDPKLPSAPSKVYMNDGWTDPFDFLGTERPGERFYATYAEASRAAQKLGFKSSAEYVKRCKQDSKLPSMPYRVYAEDWIGWYEFLGTERPGEKYATYAEASQAAQKLGLKTGKEYRKSFQQDPKLWGCPYRVYAEDWIGWYEFLGTERPGEKYGTYSEASGAAQRLGIKSGKEYRKSTTKIRSYLPLLISSMSSIGTVGTTSSIPNVPVKGFILSPRHLRPRSGWESNQG